MTRSPVRGYFPSPPRPRSPASVAAEPVLALTTFMQHAQWEGAAFLNGELDLGDDERKRILQEIGLPQLIKLHSRVRASSRIEWVQIFSREPIATMIKGLFWSDRISRRGLMPGWGEIIYDFYRVVQNMFKSEREVAGCHILFENHVENGIPPPLRDTILDIFVVTHRKALSKAGWKSPGVHEGQLLLADPKPEPEDYLD